MRSTCDRFQREWEWDSQSTSNSLGTDPEEWITHARVNLKTRAHFIALEKTLWIGSFPESSRKRNKEQGNQFFTESDT